VAEKSTEVYSNELCLGLSLRRKVSRRAKVEQSTVSIVESSIVVFVAFFTLAMYPLAICDTWMVTPSRPRTLVASVNGSIMKSG
jgi:uncharacterized membrane protein